MGKPLYAADYGLNADSTPHEMHAMRKDIMDSHQIYGGGEPAVPDPSRCAETPHFDRDRQDKKRATLEQKKQAEQAADTTEE